MHRHARILWWWVVLGQSDCGKEKGQLLTVVVVGFLRDTARWGPSSLWGGLQQVSEGLMKGWGLTYWVWLAVSIVRCAMSASMHRHARILWWWVVPGQSDCGKEKGQLLTVVVVVISPPSPRCAGSGLAPGRGRVKLPCVPAANATSPLLRRRPCCVGCTSNRGGAALVL